MILTFHKISSRSKSHWWITNDDFARMLDELSGRQFVYLDEYNPNDANQVVLTFDGPYEVNLQFAFPELARRNLPFEVFVIGDYVGKDNAFDVVEPLTNFCSMTQLDSIVNLGGRLEWHTRTHQISETATQAELLHEFTVSDEVKSRFPGHFRHFAYPHGNVTPEMKNIVRKNFESALAVDDGKVTDKYELPRVTVFPRHRFRNTSLTLLLMNYNYGNFIVECLASVERQSVKPDVIHIVDDYSSDHSRLILETLTNKYSVFLNERNLGIVENFNQAMSRVSTDLAMFLGADNYLHPNAIESMLKAFDKNPEIDICYFDMAIVGPLANNLADRVQAEKVGRSSRDNLDLFWWKFPDFNSESKESLTTSNFINGSSMFRVEAFRRVGGYLEIYPEDHNLWKRMVDSGSIAKRIPFPLLYYRQHSVSQANTALGNLLEVQHHRATAGQLRESYSEALKRIQDLNSRNQFLLEKNNDLNRTNWDLLKLNDDLSLQLQSIQNSTTWKYTSFLRKLIGVVRTWLA